MRLPLLFGDHGITAECGLINTLLIEKWISLFDRFVGDPKATSINGEVDHQLRRTNGDR
jgi:hypothetical protein